MIVKEVDAISNSFSCASNFLVVQLLWLLMHAEVNYPDDIYSSAFVCSHCTASYICVVHLNYIIIVQKKPLPEFWRDQYVVSVHAV